MAVQQLQLPGNYGPGPNNLVDQSNWATLGNLGNVYREAQDRDRQQATLAQLGTDPNANIGFLLKSGNPTLVQLGLRLQQEQTANKQSGAYLTIAQERAKREQEAAELAEEQRTAAPGLYTRMLNAGMPGLPGAAAPGTPAPFPAPLPGRGIPPAGIQPPPSAPPAGLPGAPAAVAANPMSPPGPAAPPISGPNMPPPSGSVALPPVAAAPLMPPIKAEGEESGLPVWAGPQSLAGRMVKNLVAGAPAASAGISNEVLGRALANPETKALATVFAQNKLDPGTWDVHFDDQNGRAIAINKKTLESRDVTPGGGTGGVTKEQRERQERYDDAMKRYGDPNIANYVAINKKLPSEDLHPDERKRINDLTDIANNGEGVIKNIDDLKQISPKAWGHPGALGQAQQIAGYLPSAVTPEGAIQTMNLANAARMNVATQAKSIFGPRLAVAEVKLLDELEGSANQPDAVRQMIFDRAKTMLQKKADEARTEAEGIRNKTFFKPSSGTANAAPTVATAVPGGAPAAPNAKPSLSDFMTKARAANPGVSDGELAKYWKSKYGS